MLFVILIRIFVTETGPLYPIYYCSIFTFELYPEGMSSTWTLQLSTPATAGSVFISVVCGGVFHITGLG